MMYVHHLPLALSVLFRLVSTAAGSCATGEGSCTVSPLQSETATMLQTRVRLDTTQEPVFTVPQEHWDLSGSGDFLLSALIKTTAASGVIVGKPFADGLWKNGGGAQAKMLFLRSGNLGFDIGWVGYVGCSTPVNDGQWHEVAVKYAKADGNKYQLLVDGSVCKSGLRAIPDNAATSIIVGKAIGHSVQNGTANGDMSSDFQGEIRDVKYDALDLVQAPAPFPVAVPDDNWDLSGSHDFLLSALIKTTAASGTIVGKAFAGGLWKSGGGAQAKMLFLRGGKLGFDIGWVGYVRCSTPVNDGQWHEVAVKYKKADGNKYQLLVDGSVCQSGLRAIPDNAETSISFGKAIGHSDQNGKANGDMAPAFQGKIRGVKYERPKKCFPADALVATPMGPKRMSELRAGDAVRSIDGSGQTFFDEVYFFGHADASARSEFVDLKLAGNVASLQLSDKHFVPKCPENRVPCDWSEHLNVYAKDVQVGDFLWAMRGEQLHLQEVIGSSVTVRDGLYNPYTLSGRVIVNGVLASAHSEWVLDTWMPESLTHYLPGVYQVVFLPGRWLYHLVGATAADALDVNNPQLAPEKNGSGPEFLVACAMLAITATLVFSFKR